MKTLDEIINSIIINEANFKNIGETGRISGTLYMEIKRIITECREQAYQDGVIDGVIIKKEGSLNWQE